MSNPNSNIPQYIFEVYCRILDVGNTEMYILL